MINNVVVEVLTIEHGKEVVDTFRKLGVRTDMQGTQTREDVDRDRYYGLIKGTFSCYSLGFVDEFKVRIVTLEQLKRYLITNKVIEVW